MSDSHGCRSDGPISEGSSGCEVGGDVGFDALQLLFDDGQVVSLTLDRLRASPPALPPCYPPPRERSATLLLGREVLPSS